MSEIYTGVKFKTVHLSTKSPLDKLIYELIFWANFMSQNNMTPPNQGGSAGNLSFRCTKAKNQFIITATASDLGLLINNSKFIKVVACNYKSMTVEVEGLFEPSSESFLHHKIYEKRPEINAILHGHWPELLKNTENMNLPETKQEKPYGSMELVKEMEKIIDKANFIVLKNHGFLSLGKNIDQAGEQIMSIQKELIAHT